jgi:hypothetical protein
VTKTPKIWVKIRAWRRTRPRRIIFHELTEKFGFETDSDIIPVMVERRLGIAIIEYSERRERVWTRLFFQVSRLGEIRKQLVTNLAPFGKFYLSPEDPREVPPHGIRVNPASVTSEGKPKTIVIDADYEGQHTQQIVLEATWNGSEPTIVANNQSKVHGAISVLPYEALGAAATVLIEHRIELAENEMLESFSPTNPDQIEVDSRFFLRMPESYSPRVN